MENFERLTDEELISQLSMEFEFERRASHRILLYLAEVKRRRLYFKHRHASMFEMLTRHFRLSETSAYQRLKALELITDVPLVEEKLVSGEVNLSTLAMTARQVQREEKVTRKKVSKNHKAVIVNAILGKTQKEAEKVLFDLLPASALKPRESEKRVSSSTTHVNWNLPNDMTDMITRLKEIWANVDPQMDSVEVLRRALKLTLKRVDPLLKTQNTAESAKRRVTSQGIRPSYYPVSIRSTLWQRAQAQCEIVMSGKRCSSRHALEIDHIVALAKGGSNEISNLRVVCRAHNQELARQMFGEAFIKRKTELREPVRAYLIQ